MMTNFGESASSNVSVVNESFIKEENNSSLSENMEIKDFNLLNVKEEFLFPNCDNTDMSSDTVKEEMHSEASSELNEYASDDSVEKTNQTLPDLGSKIGQECLKDIVTPFCFVGIKMENYDDYESSCSETKHSMAEYPSNIEIESNMYVQALKEKLRVKLKNNTSMGKGDREDVNNCKSDFKTNESSSEEVMSRMLNCNSVVHSNEIGNSSDELIRGIVCQEFSIPNVKQQDNWKEQCSGNSNNPGCDGTRTLQFKSTEVTVGAMKNETNSDNETRTKSNAKRLGRNKLTKHTPNARERLYRCSQCNASFYCNSKLIIHVRSHTGEKPHRCSYCEASFNLSSTLRKHLRTHTGVKPYECSVCGRAFSARSNLKTHARIHTGEKLHACSVCERSFSQRGSLRQHMLIHTGEKPFRCGVCASSYRYKATLEAHVATHSGENRFGCDMCDRSFNVKSYLKSHLRIHTGEKPFGCTVCEAAFKLKSGLNSHMRIHTGERPHACSVCERSFSGKGSLKQHMLIHTGERPYHCECCAATFNSSSTLKMHLRTHTGEKPYVCDVCDRSFTVRNTLKTHMRIHT